MRHLPLDSTSSLEPSRADDASTDQSNASSVDTAPSSAPQSRSSSVKSSTHTLPNRPKRSSLRSSLKASKSAPSLAVRFSLPERPPDMPRLEPDVPPPPHKEGPRPAKAMKPIAPTRGSSGAPAQPPLRMKLSKRFSAPAPISRKEGNRTSAPPIPIDGRNFSAPRSSPNSRVTSFQSTASAPPILQSTLSPSQPPSQYNPLQHHIPCLFPNCKTYYTHSLLGPTFYSPQQPYGFLRKRALCPFHAHQDMKIASHKAKSIWESMRQHAGRKTLGLIAAEFEIWVQQLREERADESEELELRQRNLVLGNGGNGIKKKEKGNASAEGEWKYIPRPCTKKGCGKQWYSPFDNRLYLFYHTSRESGLVPLSTLCPSCAKADVESAEDRIEERKVDANAGPEWVQWCEQIRMDREMEQDYWLQAQERVVREKGIPSHVAVSTNNRNIKRASTVEKKSKKSDKLKGICIVM